MIHDYDFHRGDLVLMCNMQIEKSLNCKMRLRYLGLLFIVSCNHRAAYIIAELDGTVGWFKHLIFVPQLVSQLHRNSDLNLKALTSKIGNRV